MSENDIVADLRYWAERGLFNMDELNRVANEVERLRDNLEEARGTVSISALANQQLKARHEEEKKELVDKLKWYANKANEAIAEANLFRAALREIRCTCDEHCNPYKSGCDHWIANEALGFEDD